jgi:Tol biopolymer transport system component
VVFDLQANAGQSQRDVFVAGTDGSPMRPLVQHPADDRFPLWTADGRVMFLSTRQRHVDAFVLTLVDGEARSEPVIAARSLIGATPFALTDDGTLFYQQSMSNVEVVTASVNLDTPMPIGPPAPLPGPLFGERMGPAWSPNGRWLAFIDRTSGLLNVKDTLNGTIRELAVLTRLGTAAPRWSPDSASLIVRGSSRQQQTGYFRVDLSTGKTSPAVLFDAPSNETDYGSIDWSHDGGSVLYAHLPRGIVSRDLATGAETIIAARTELPVDTRIARLSPDGRSLAVFGRTAESGDYVLRVRTDAGPFRDVVTFSSPAHFSGWSPDGRYFILRHRPGPQPDPFHLWVVPVAGGERRQMGPLPGTTIANPAISISPDGRQVAYTQGIIRSQPWVLNDFLPAVRTGGR